MNKHIIILGLLLHGLYIQAQEKVLTLEEAIATAQSNNKTVKMAELDRQIADANYKQANAVYMPQASVNYTAFSTNNPLNAFGFKLQQQGIKASDFNPDLLNNPDQTSNFQTSFDVQQPILNMDMLLMRQSAGRQADVYQYKSQRTKEYITFETTKAFLQLQMAQKAVKVLQEVLLTAKEVYTFTDNRFQQGLVHKSDLLNAEIQKRTIETQLAEAKSNIRNAADYLSILMGNAAGTEYSITETTALNSSKEQSVISDSRSDFLAMSKAIESSSLMSRSYKMSYLPKINAFGSFYINDKSALGFSSKSYLAGVQLSWNILKGTKTKHSIDAQNLTTQKLTAQLDEQKAQNQMLLNKTLREIEDSKLKMEQQKAAITQAEEAFILTGNRYRQGLVSTNDLMMAQNQLSQQKLQNEQIIFTNQVLQAYLQLLTTP